MRIDRGKQRSPNAVYAVLVVRYVCARAGVAKLFRQAEVDYIDKVGGLGCPHYKVCGLDVSVNKVARMNKRNARDLYIVKLRAQTREGFTHQLVRK